MSVGATGEGNDDVVVSLFARPGDGGGETVAPVQVPAAEEERRLAARRAGGSRRSDHAYGKGTERKKKNDL